MAYKKKYLSERKIKQGDLRQQYNYYKRQMQKRLIEEEALNRALGLATISPSDLFIDRTFNQVFKEGITRKVKKSTKRFTGEQAVKIQIESFRARASKTHQNRLFVMNYISAMEKAGYDPAIRDYAFKILNKTPNYKLTILIKKDILPSIQEVYKGFHGTEFMTDVFEKLERLETSGLKQIGDEAKTIKERQKKYMEIIKAERLINTGVKY